MIICGERLILEESNDKKTTWRNCIIEKDHHGSHKFEGLEYTEMKRELILSLAIKMNPNTPFWFCRQHNEFEKWDNDQQIAFGIRFMVHADLLNWSIEKKLFFLHNLSRDHHYVNNIMKLNTEMNKMAVALVFESERDPLVRKQIEHLAKEALDTYQDTISKN